MNPDNGNSQSGGSPTPSPQDNQQTAAANVLRSQIDTLYQPEKEPTNPYERTHTNHPEPQADQWKAYHSAWQNYYQQYYRAFYEQQQSADTQTTTPIGSQSASPEQASDTTNTRTNEISKDRALSELRQKLRNNVRRQTLKVRHSRHFIPIIAALGVVLIFVFLQYNRVFIATVNAYISPGAIDPQNIVIDPNTNGVVSADPRLIIPKINVDVPVVYDIGPDYDSQMTAMEKGVAHFAIAGANSHPGEIGNTVLSGHSSNDLFDPGDYKFIFAQLEKLNISDTIYANYQGVRYTYVVTKKEVVLPTEVNKLVYPTNKPVLTLITCTPLGTSQKRLLVTAEQVSPDPSQAASAPTGSGQNGTGESDTSLPGSSPTFVERLFGE